MNIIHFFVSILPFFLLLTVGALIYNVIQERKVVTKLNFSIFSVIVIMLIIFAWYYFPHNNILTDYTTESITIHVKGEIINITDEVEMDKIKNILNDYTYVRNVNDSLNSTFFESDKLIRIDYNIKNKDKLKLIHIYVMYSNTANSEEQQQISKSNRLQINEQFYSVKKPYELSKELYNYLIKSYDFDL